MRRLKMSKRALIAAAVGACTGAVLAMSGVASAVPGPANDLGFAPITTNALPCSAIGTPQFANDNHGNPMTPTVLMQAGDPATPVNAPATSNAVGHENDMIALSQNGKYLFTPSEADPSDGITRLTLKGPDAGKKDLLAKPTTPPAWSRMDGMKWYPFGGPTGDGVLLASEEFPAGGIWQINPETGDFARLDWLGNFSHEGVGLDDAGNLYLGDENRAGAIYKAVPNDVGDLTKGGTLFYLVGTGIDGTSWKGVSNPANAINEASNGGAILFDRPEDFDEHNGLVYFAVTEPKSDADTHHGNYNGTPGGGPSPLNQISNQGGVYALTTNGVPSLSTQSGALPPYSNLTPMIQVQDPKYTTQDQAKAQQGLQFPDNLAFDGRGNLWVHEDIPDGSTFPANGTDVGKQARDQQDELYVYKLGTDGASIVPNLDTSGPGVSGGYKAADMRTSPGAVAANRPCDNEFTGGIFGQDGKTLYINQQHSENPTLTVRIG
jgi:secreted PhoX family phosphatase